MLNHSTSLLCSECYTAPMSFGKSQVLTLVHNALMIWSQLPAGLTSHHFHSLSPLSLPFFEQSQCTLASGPLPWLFLLLRTLFSRYLRGGKGERVGETVRFAVPDRGDTHVLSPATMSNGTWTTSS